MLLGKRPRPSMKRTTSMTEISFDLEMPLKERQKPTSDAATRRQSDVSSFSPTKPRRNSADFVQTDSFLSSCGLCKRRLGPERDIYMYRGDIAFCSLECRQQQMNQDERKEKCSLASMKRKASSSVAGSEASSNGETMAAA